MTYSLRARVAAGLLAAAAFMPWYSSQALVDHDTYVGNPLPLIDWVIVAAALVVLVQPKFAIVAGVLGLIAVVVGALLMYGDSAEGLRVSVGPGLPLAAAASIALLIFRPKADSPPEVAAPNETH